MRRHIKTALIVAGVLMLLLAGLIHVAGAEDPANSIWEEIPHEEKTTYINKEEQGKDMGVTGPVQEIQEGECQKDAPAAGPVIEVSYDEAQLLLRIAQAEAGNQGEEGMWLVMSVVLNRVASPDFPDSIREVIFQDYQFTSVLDGNFDKAVISEPCHEALARIESGDVAKEIIGFEVKTSEELDNYFSPAFEYRDHRFYTKKGD